MIKRLASTRFTRRFSEPIPMLCGLGAITSWRRSNAIGPAPVPKKICSGLLSAEHKLWWVETTQEQRGMSERGRPRICKPEHADLSRKFYTLGTSSPYLVTLWCYYR